MKIAAHAFLFDLHFTGTEGLGRTDDGVVVRLVKIRHVIGVEPDLRSEELRIQHGVFGARGGVHPGEIGEGEGSEVIDRGTGRRRR